MTIAHGFWASRLYMAVKPDGKPQNYVLTMAEKKIAHR